MADGVTLSIGAGVDVRFGTSVDLDVDGALIAVGTVDAPINFKPIAGGSPWGRVRIGGGNVYTDSDSSHLSFVTFEGGGGWYGRSLDVYRNTPTLDHLTIRDSIGDGLYVYDSDNLSVTMSNFINNAGYGLYNATPSQAVTATLNYWGVPSGPYHPTSNPAGAGAEVSDGVIFDPWLRGSSVDIYIVNRTATNYDVLSYDPGTYTYTLIKKDGTIVHFDADGFHQYTLDRNGNKTAYTYNSDETVATMSITPAGESTPRWIWTFSYENGKLSTITDPAGRVTSFTINGSGHLTEVMFPDATNLGFFYDASALMTQQVDQTGEVTGYTYDGYGRIATVTEPPRPVYDPATGQTEITQEVRTFAPSDTGYALINDSPLGDPDNPAPPVPTSADLVDRVDYGRGGRSGHTNKYGNWLDETDGEGRTTYYQRDETNNITRIDYPDGDCVEYTYDDMGNRLTENRMGAAQCALPLTQEQNWVYTYEERFNQIKTEMDPLGNTITYVYDYEEDTGDAGNLIRVEYPPVDDGTGQVVTPTISYTYNAWGLLETETDARGTVTIYIYTQGTPDEASNGATPLFISGVTPVPGLLTQIIEDSGGENLTTTHRDFDGAGNTGTVVGPDGHDATTYAYDAMNRITSETNAVGIVTLYQYDGRGNLLRQIVDYTLDGTTGRNVITEYSYDPNDQLLNKQTIDAGLLVQTSYTYDVNRQLAIQQDGLGNQLFYLYDNADQLVNVIDPGGYVTTYTYTLDGQLGHVVDADGYVTRYVYDGYGWLESEIRDDGNLNLTTSYTYDSNDNLLTTTAADDTVTCYEYDSHNRRTVEVLDCGGLDLITNYAYDLNNNPLYVTDPRGVVTYYEYDALNRVTLMRSDDGGLNLETDYSYDAAGNLAQVTGVRGVVTAYVYDDLNRLVQSCQDALGLNLCTGTDYDRLNNQETVTDPNSITTRTEYNAFGRRVQVIQDEGALNATTNYSYDHALNLVSVTDANGNMTSYDYGSRNELISENYADNTVVGYSFDGRGNLLELTNQDGEIITHIYDGANRLRQRTFSTGGSQNFAYNEVGRLIDAQQSMNGHSSQLTFIPNPLGDIVDSNQAIDGLSWNITYDYDYVNGIYTTTYPSGVQRSWTLDPQDRIEVVRDENGSSIAGYSYNDLSSYDTVSYANGLTTRTDYDALYRVKRVSSAVADYRYGYDAAGNRTYMQRWHKPGQPADVYQYDNLYQPAQVWYGADAATPGAITSYDSLQWYDLDNLGNRLEVQNDGISETYLPNDGQTLTNSMNRYEQVDSNPFSYDLRGNTLADAANTYNYDILNRQIGMTGATDYIYDALGRRIAKVVDGVTTYYIYDYRYRVLEERAEDNSLDARFTYGAGIDEILMMEYGGNSYYYHHDAQTSITEITDAAGGLVERYEYDIYGSPDIFDSTDTLLTGSTINNPYLYTARRYDPESGNYYFRARMYSPETGRFLQMDPLGYVDGLNLYASYFVINGTDPSGNLSMDKVELISFSAYAGFGGGASVSVKLDFKDCCKNDKLVKDGDRTISLQIAGELGIGLGGKVTIGGVGVNLLLKGPRIIAKSSLSISNSGCGGRLDTLSRCEKVGVNLGTQSKGGAYGISLNLTANVEGTMKVCGRLSSSGASVDIQFCGKVNVELNYQVGPYKGNIVKTPGGVGCRSVWSKNWNF